MDVLELKELTSALSCCKLSTMAARCRRSSTFLPLLPWAPFDEVPLACTAYPLVDAGLSGMVCSVCGTLPAETAPGPC